MTCQEDTRNLLLCLVGRQVRCKLFWQNFSCANSTAHGRLRNPQRVLASAVPSSLLHSPAKLPLSSQNQLRSSLQDHRSVLGQQFKMEMPQQSAGLKRLLHRIFPSFLL
jgi:hypothetical protein